MNKCFKFKHLQKKKNYKKTQENTFKEHVNKVIYIYILLLVLKKIIITAIICLLYIISKIQKLQA